MSLCVLQCRNEQYFTALQSVWNQLFINIKSLISWQYCLHDISLINSLTITMVTQYSHTTFVKLAISIILLVTCNVTYIKETVWLCLEICASPSALILAYLVKYCFLIGNLYPT